MRKTGPDCCTIWRARFRAGCNIEVVLIDTEAHKALDVFYVTAQGKKLEEEKQLLLRSELLAACVSLR